RQVVIMGGVETNADERGVALADRSAYNNTTDQASADETYRRVQELGVPLVILNKESTYAAAAPRNFYDGIAATGHPVGMYLNGQQRASLEHLWTGILKGNLPPRLTPAWFFQTFTDIDVNSAAGQDILAARLAHPDDFSAIWKLVSHFNLYDPLALLATVPQIDALLYRAERVPGCRGQVALIGKNSIRDVLLVKDLMSAAAIESLNLDPLLKSRSQTVPGYPPRQMVDATLADWNRPWPDYRPPAFTAEAVLNLPSQSADSREIQNVARRFLTWRGSREVPVTRDQQGFPLNPFGRTGLCGRGDWPRWGRNQYAEALFTRVHPESGRLQMLLVRPQATGPGTLPGDVVVPDEDQLHAVRRALQGAAGAELPLTEARLICANVVDDPRNTDNAWRETAIWHLHLNASVPNGEILAGQRAGRIWVWADIHLDLLRSLPQLESDSLWIALDQLQKKSPEMGRFIDDLLKAPDDANQGASLPQAK
ncbi:MAG: hypothetical protein JSS02_17735, partial [Planctomycetes bacterium]|nr:hypothetical protein [Planctomycetota bacterium]